MNKTDNTSRIQEILKDIRLYKNPEELEELKKLIKKNVPLSMRGYFMAYLFVNGSGYAAKSSTKQSGHESSAKAVKAERPQLNREDAVSFYINVGRASRSNSKELAAFVVETAHLSEEDILSVAFKQNYSFIYIKKEKADGVIEAVTGQSFKGRKVKMNFSKDAGSEQ